MLYAYAWLQLGACVCGQLAPVWPWVLSLYHVVMCVYLCRPKP